MNPWGSLAVSVPVNGGGSKKTRPPSVAPPPEIHFLTVETPEPTTPLAEPRKFDTWLGNADWMTPLTALAPKTSWRSFTTSLGSPGSKLFKPWAMASDV